MFALVIYSYSGTVKLLHKYIYQGIRENRIMSIANDMKAYIAEQFTTTRRKNFSFTDDYVFKAVFGQDNDRSKKALILLLNTILDRKIQTINQNINATVEVHTYIDSEEVANVTTDKVSDNLAIAHKKRR